MAGRLATLRAQAFEAHKAFGARQESATRSVAAAAGAAPGSESWSVATIAVADLETSRSSAMVALAELDELLVKASLAAVDGPDTDLKAVRATHDEVSAWIAAEDQVLGGLKDRVRA